MSTENDQHRLHRLLVAAAPDRPELDPASRSRAVAERARAAVRRTRLAVAGGVAVVVIAVAVPLGLGGGDEETPVAADPTPGAVEPAPCPEPPVDVDTLGPVDDLPDDAPWARVCAAHNAFMAFPREPLVGGDAEMLVAAIESLPRYQPEELCAVASIVSSPWTLVVGSRGTSPVTIGTGAIGCSTVVIDGIPRSAARVLDLVGPATPATTSSPAPCPVIPYEVVGGPTDVALPEDVVEVRACPAVFEGTPGVRPGSDRDTALPVEVLRDGIEDFVAAIGGLPDPDVDRCAAATPAVLPWSLQVSGADGSAVILGAATVVCSDLVIDGRAVETEAVLAAFREAVEAEG